MMLNGEETTRAWLPSHVYATLEEAVDRVDYLIAQYSTPGNPQLGPYVLGIEHAATGRLLGHVGFSPLNEDVEISYAIAEDSRGHGYAAEAIVAACGWAASAFGLTRIVALTASANGASRRALERAAFSHTAERRMPFQGEEAVVSIYAWAAVPEAPR